MSLVFVIRSLLSIGKETMLWNICWNAKDNFHLELWTRFFRTLCLTTSQLQHSCRCRSLFCHQKQYNFGASRLREKELTKEKMSYVSWHANILELHQACLKHSTGTTRHYYAQMIGFHSLFKKNKGRRRGKNLQRKKVERSASDFLFCFPVKEQKNEEITWPFS